MELRANGHASNEAKRVLPKDLQPEGGEANRLGDSQAQIRPCREAQKGDNDEKAHQRREGRDLRCAILPAQSSLTSSLICISLSNLERLKRLQAVCHVVERVEVHLKVFLNQRGVLIHAFGECLNTLSP